MMIRDVILPAFSFSILGVVSLEEMSFWERLLEKWGIGMVMLALFCALAKWTANQEEKRLAIQEAHEQKAQEARDKKEDENQLERKLLLSENNSLQKLQMSLMEKHSQRIEALTKESNKSRDDNSAALRMMLRKMGSVPCVGKMEKSEIANILGEKEI